MSRSRRSRAIKAPVSNVAPISAATPEPKPEGGRGGRSCVAAEGTLFVGERAALANETALTALLKLSYVSWCPFLTMLPDGPMKLRPAPWSRLGIWLLVLASLATSAPAGAQDHGPSLAILGLSSKDGDDEAAAKLTGALRAQAAAAELKLSDSSALLSQLVVLHDCEITGAACRDGIARQLEVDELIYGAIRRSEGGHKVELHRYSTVDASLTHASRELTIEGASEAELASEARGLLRELRPSDTSEQPAIEPAPAPEPARARRPLPLFEPHDAEPQDESSSNDWLGYSLLGVAAISTGLTVYSWNEIDAARSDTDFRAYREAVGRTQTGAGVDDVCDEADVGRPYSIGVERLKRARSACGRGVTFELLQWVFMGSALLSAGVGMYFLLDDEGRPDAARASLLPVIGKDDAGVQLRIQL